MIGIMLAASLILTAAPAAGQIVKSDGSNAKWIAFDRNGALRLDLQAGTHRATVKFTVAEPPAGWPDAMWIGPDQVEMKSDSVSDRMITAVDILVDGCAVDQPWPAIAGFAAPNKAGLQFVKEHWQLEIFGGDGAEAYGVVYAFDNQHVLARQLTWGPVSDEDTRYRITVDPDVAPRYCETSGDTIPARPSLPSPPKPR